jgi:transposase
VGHETYNGNTQKPGEKIVKDINRATRKQYSSEEKIRIVLDGLRGEDSIAELCRREGISQGVYYKWSKDFMEAGKRRLAGDTARAATTDEGREIWLEHPPADKHSDDCKAAKNNAGVGKAAASLTRLASGCCANRDNAECVHFCSYVLDLDFAKVLKRDTSPFSDMIHDCA